MYLAITIDVEEDNWSNYATEPVLSNIEKISTLQALFDRYSVKPTYLVTYPVAADRNAVSILRKIMEDGRCEIGTHVHPWNTPPFEEEKTFRNTMLCNLGKEIQYRKIESLHVKIHENFGVEPISFRSGRWGFDRIVAGNIRRLGYKVDTSVSPYLNWERDCGPDYSDHSPEIRKLPAGENGEPDSCILEVPATIGFLQSDFDSCNKWFNTILNSKLKYFRLLGILDKLGIINKVWLSPEMANGNEMTQLAKSVEREGYTLLNMFFHSSSLKAGLTPFTKSHDDEKNFLNRIEEFLQGVAVNKVQSIPLRESYDIYRH